MIIVSFETYTMPPVVKKPCINNAQFSYSGKELSPLGNGYSADAEQVGTIMEGRDKSMWMIGIKNGVKVWNRVPTDLSKDPAILADLTPPDMKAKEEVIKKKAAPKKKATTKKVAVTTAVSESEVEADGDAEDKDTPAPKDDKKKKVKAPAKAKKTKKGDEANADEGEEAKTAVPVKEKAKRQPTDFNNFMSYQIKIIGEENPGMTHKEKFAKVASLWKSLGDDERKAILEKAKKKTGGDDEDE